MVVKVVSKVLGLLEDLSIGRGTEAQTRNGNVVNGSKIDALWLFDTVAQIKALDTTLFTRVGLDNDNTNGILTNYYYDSGSAAAGDDDLVLVPDVGTGRWLKQIIHSGYKKKTDAFSICPSQMRPDGTNAVTSLHNTYWDCIAFPDAVVGLAYMSIPIPEGWGTGEITSVDVFFSTDTANTADEVNLHCILSSFATGESTSTLTINEEVSPTVNDTANLMQKTTITFTTPVPVAANDLITLRFARHGNDAADTMTGDFELLGLKLNYTI